MKRRSFLAGIAAAFAAPFIKAPAAAPIAVSEYTVTQVTISADAAISAWRHVATWRGIAEIDKSEAA